MRKIISWAAVALGFIPLNTAFPQNVPKENLAVHTVYAEAGGGCGLYSINYDHVFYGKRRAFNFGLGAGFSYSYLGGYNKASITAIPLHLVLLIHTTLNGSVEIGLNPSLDIFDRITSSKSASAGVRKSSFDIAIIPHIGYRYQAEKGGLFGKIYFCPLTAFGGDGTVASQTPFYNQNSFEKGIIPWGGLALGYTFKRTPQ